MNDTQKSRFTDNNDGTVTDNKTGLIWMKDANYFGKSMHWQAAMDACAVLSSSPGWRLPERMELESLLDLSQSDPALPLGHPFINVQSSYYWSSTTYARYTYYAWIVSMYYGSVYYDSKTGNGCYYVWPVRAGQ